jgi:hypothetical protein
VGLHYGRHQILRQAILRLPDAEEIAWQGRRCGAKAGTREAKQQRANMPDASSDQNGPMKEHVWNFAAPAWRAQVKPGKAAVILNTKNTSIRVSPAHWIILLFHSGYTRELLPAAVAVNSKIHQYAKLSPLTDF